MMNFATRISSVAMLALAALPIAALPAQALAATTVKVSDLDLLSPQGVAAFEQRSDQAARTFCRNVFTLSRHASCRAGVKDELAEKVAVVRAAQLGRATTFAAR
jgi:UrcA family protein